MFKTLFGQSHIVVALAHVRLEECRNVFAMIFGADAGHTVGDGCVENPKGSTHFTCVILGDGCVAKPQGSTHFTCVILFEVCMCRCGGGCGQWRCMLFLCEY